MLMSNHYSQYVKYIDSILYEYEELIKSLTEDGYTKFDKLLVKLSPFHHDNNKDMIEFYNGYIADMKLLKNRILTNDVDFHQVDIDELEELKDNYE